MSAKSQKQIHEQCLVGRHYVVNNPEVIKIRTIKRKHLEQIRSLAFRTDEKMLDRTFHILGVHQFDIIVRLPGNENHLRKIGTVDYKEKLRAETDMTINEIKKVVRDMPQIFGE